MPLRLLLILLPLTEIALFVVIGGWIGVWGVLAWVILGALAGILILRGRLRRLPELLNAGRDPARLLAGGAMTALGAFLLILPGFATDALGLVLLFPPVQALVGNRLTRSMGQTTARSQAWRGTVIEGEYVVTDPEDPQPPPERPSLPGSRLPPNPGDRPRH